MTRRVIGFVALFIVWVTAGPGGQSRQVEWLTYGGSPGGDKYSPADDITPQNVQRLTIAWQWEHGEKPLEEYGTVPFRFENQPLMVDGVLYVTTPYNNAAALDADTGKELWRFESGAVKLGGIPGTGFKHRAPALWRDTRDGNKLRVLLNTRNQLFSLDAQTGKPVASFGDNGVVSLTDAYPRPISDIRHVNHGGSPPVVYRDIVVVGGAIPDRYQMTNEPPGIVQGFDARTGKRLWVWNAIPQSPTDFGADTWEEGSWRFNGHAQRLGADGGRRDARARLLRHQHARQRLLRRHGGRARTSPPSRSSASTSTAGQRKWSFQMVHHGLWDFDNPAAPNLVTITVDGKRIDAVAQVTKQGFTYVFDRVTGEPVWPIVERPVPTDSDVPGEKVWPTQPFPTKPPPFARQGVSLDDANDLTPEIKELALAEMKKYRHRSALHAAVAARDAAAAGQRRRRELGRRDVGRAGGAALRPQQGRDPLQQRVIASDGTRQVHRSPLLGTSAGGASRAPSSARFRSIKPPYAHLTAIDLNKGEIVWQVPLGEGSAGDPQSSAAEGCDAARPTRLAGQRRRAFSPAAD